MEIHAHYIGKAQAFQELGFSEEAVKLAFVQDGLPDATSELLVKEAWGGLISGGLKALGGLIGRGAGRMGGKLLGAGAKRGGTLGKMMQWGGQKTIGAGKATGQALKGLRTAPGKTMMGGMKNLGTGMLTAQGQGVGGALGKGMFAAGMASNFMPSGSPPPPQYNQQGQY